MSDEQRRNYSEEEDVMLLRQVLGDRPFHAQRGKITGAWDALAAKLVADDSFPRLKLSGKNAQSRFDKLVKTRRQEKIYALSRSDVMTNSGSSNRRASSNTPRTSKQNSFSAFGQPGTRG
ncbi:hypothetical protein PC116_g13212 [Phytophthora cactorum]|uniref:Myb/SANT-like domain-containing protein n=1 Tax=Phytophthora cactorum TaxID=29920 RepID=A0A8T1KRE7_9STRA|nr:hypothetical protein Pcac1_g9918 [Phytophthora cactorum]KAG2825359.1 hypothetical protein PC112_g9717 [Phytophthora cactorum]KAG2829480.1 hypothetical protein PC111_g7740 [Phytophthora cactorum]KAG2920598.1 hypothetical protein PC115_g9753 [Phytophthora cactorum]KAG2938378.1 hypothetical protein PC117_g11271 [Phytophthora cactorum]